VYEAIRLAAPGGLGRAAKGDVNDGPTGTLLEMMELAADRDLVARQYATAYADAREGSLRLEELLADGMALGDAVVRVFVELIAVHGDTLIERTCGREVSLEAARRAREALETARGALPDARLATLDAWLREDSNRRNPGACADVTAAILHLGIVAGRVPLPLEALLHANV
jgi:triphosphoribosyl-dephospho-CoA synthase